MHEIERNGGSKRVGIGVIVAAGLSLASCTTAQRAGIVAKAESPGAQAILRDVTTAGLNIGLDLVTGNEPGAVVAGIQGAASAVRDYEGLAAAPSRQVIATAAADGAGVPVVAGALTAAIPQIIQQAQNAALARGVRIEPDAITEALARGFDQVAPASAAVTGGAR